MYLTTTYQAPSQIRRYPVIGATNWLFAPGNPGDLETGEPARGRRMPGLGGLQRAAEVPSARDWDDGAILMFTKSLRG